MQAAGELPNTFANQSISDKARYTHQRLHKIMSQQNSQLLMVP